MTQTTDRLPLECVELKIGLFVPLSLLCQGHHHFGLPGGACRVRRCRLRPRPTVLPLLLYCQVACHLIGRDLMIPGKMLIWLQEDVIHVCTSMESLFTPPAAVKSVHVCCQAVHLDSAST